MKQTAGRELQRPTKRNLKKRAGLRSHRRALCWRGNRRMKKNGGGEIFGARKILDSGRQKLTRKIRAEQRPRKQRQESDLVPNEEISERTQQTIQGRASPTARKIDEKIRARAHAHRRAHIQQLKNQTRKTNTKKKNNKLHKIKYNPDFSLKSHDIHTTTEITTLSPLFD
jgi:hypothetical protein